MAYRPPNVPIAREPPLPPETSPTSPPFDASANPTRPATERHAAYGLNTISTRIASTASAEA